MKRLRLYQGIRYRQLLLDFQNRAERLQQQADGKIFRRQAVHGKLQRHPCHVAFLAQRHRAQDGTHLLEAPVFEDALHQFKARIFLVFQFLFGRLGQHHARLDLQERRRHDEKFACNLDIELAGRI